MFTQKINYIWAINLILFVTVVFLGIEQAGKRCSDIKIRKQNRITSYRKRDLSEGNI